MLIHVLRRRAKADDVAALTEDTPPDVADKLRMAELAAAREEELLAADLEMLRSFASTLSVRLANGQVVKAT